MVVCWWIGFFCSDDGGGGSALLCFDYLRVVLYSIFASPAGRGGEGRRWWLWAICFWWWFCRWSSSSATLLRPALVARGAASAGVWAMRLVGLDGVASAGSWVELGRGCRGRVRSATSYSVARRRMTLAAVFYMWWLLFAGGWWYSDVCAVLVSWESGGGSDRDLSRRPRVLCAFYRVLLCFLFFVGPGCNLHSVSF